MIPTKPKVQRVITRISITTQEQSPQKAGR
jgi:hypothetical protein